MALGILDLHMKKKKKLHYYLYSQKVTRNGLNSLNVRPEAIKLLDENIKKKLLHTGLGNDKSKNKKV